MFKNRKGFTLIELIIVMAIIAILVLLAAPKFMDYVKTAKETQIKNDIKVVENVVQAEIAKNVANDEDITILEETKLTGEAYDKTGKKVEEASAQKISDKITEVSKLKENKGDFYYSEETGQAYFQENKITE